MSENIYQKLAVVQKQLLTVNFKKSGKNSFNKFNYYELEDILPIIQCKCLENNLLLEFSFSGTEATLKLRDINCPEKIISNRMPMPEITQINKGMNIMQSLGAYITYLKRYLLLNTFLICEKDIIDSVETNQEKQTTKTKKYSKPSKEFTTADHDKPLWNDSSAAAKISEIAEQLEKQGQDVDDKRIHQRAIGMKNRKQIDAKMLKEIEGVLGVA